MQKDNQNPLYKIIVRIAFVLGVILAIALLAFAATRFLPRFFKYIGTASASLFSSVFRGAPELVVTTSKSSVASDETFVVSWQTASSTTGSSLKYACTSGLSLNYIGSQNTRIPVTCGKDFKIGGKSTEATLSGTLAKANSFADIDLEVTVQTTEGSTISGKTLVTVKSGNTTSTQNTQENSTTTVTTTPNLTSEPLKPTKTNPYIPQYTSTPTGPADLVVSDISSVMALGNPVVQFVVSNVGGVATGPWSLLATVPNSQKLLESNNLASLSPGQSILYTLHLGNTLRNGTHSIVIFADSASQVSESNEINNSNQITITVNTGINDYSGKKADLVPKIIRTGYLPNGMVGVTFEIRNIGGTTARDWRFEAELPTDDEETYRSTRQIDLPAGSAMEYTLGFDNIDSGSYFEINADSDDEVNEGNERNNTARIKVTN